MSKWTRQAAALAGCALVSISPALAQRGGNDWMTVGNDAQRSNWLRNDGKISLDTMTQPGFQLLWKFKLNTPGKRPTPGALLDFYISYRGFRTLGFFGTADKITGIDTDLGRLEWEHPLAPAPASAASTPQCPGGMTSPITRRTAAGYPANFGGGRGRGAMAASGVGEPFEGAVTLKNRPAQPNFFPPPPAAARPGRRPTAAPPNPFARQPLYVDAIAADGSFHSMYVSNGEEPNAPVPFLPANANAIGLLVFDNAAYAATINNCGGVENGIWALNLETKQVKQWKAGANIAGTAGFAAGPDGVIYVAAGTRVSALAPKTLDLKASYDAGVELNSSPVVFEYKDKDYVAVTSADGRLHLLDGEKLGALAATDAFSGAKAQPGALATWADAAGTRWILVPATGGAPASPIKNGAIATWKLAEKSGIFSWEKGWISRDLVSPLPPILVNGVVFAVAGSSTAAPPHGTLYALDALTGKELWNSGAAIASRVSTGGLAAGGGRVYVAGQDGTQYAFGFPMEH